MKILVTGARGMLGRTLARHLAPRHDLILVDREEFDIGNPGEVHRAVQEVAPNVVIHAAAMTQVDRCETEGDEAFRVNALGSANIAAAANRFGARVIAISTDYVFAGDLDRAYDEFQETRPKTIYGQSKLAGEKAVERFCPNHLIARIAWLYGPGGPSFVHTMLKLGSDASAPALRVVDDQRGNPTSTDAVAQALSGLLEVPLVGVVHLTCEGETTWYEFTTEIFRLRGFARAVEPCTTREFPRPAPRPANSSLDNRVLRLANLPPMPDWRIALTDFLKEYPNG